jgi:uncharacterized membrane protein YgcG
VSTSSRLRTAIGAGAIAVLGLILVSAAPAQALPSAEASRTTFEAIVSFDVKAEVQANTDMVITETIVYDPGTDEVHRGILRGIPTQDILDDGNIRLYDVKILSVTLDGEDVPVEETEGADTISLKIGDPNVAIEGLHTFVIAYSVSGALDVIQPSSINDKTPAGIKAGDIELYWDFIGDRWPYPIYQGTASITGPTPALAALCFYGPAGSTKQCQVEQGADSATVLSADLSGGGALTGVIGWAPDGFTQMPTPNITPDPMVEQVSRLKASIPFLLVIALAALAAPITTAVLRRRSNAGVVLAATPVRYSPPDGLRPAQVQAGVDGTVDSRGYTATLLDLAARGHITLTEQDGGWLGGKQLNIGWTGTGKDTLAGWENDLVGAILKGSSAATMGSYDPVLTATTSTLTSRLSAEAKSTGLYNPDGDRPDRSYVVLSILGGVMVVVGFFISFILGDYALSSMVLFALTGLALVTGGLVGRAITPRRQTKISANFLGQVAGFRRLLNSDSADARRDFAEKIGLTSDAIFATFMPYAVVLGLESTWVSTFPDITPEQLRPYGLYTSSVIGLGGWSRTMEDTFASSTTAPSTPGSSWTSDGGSGFGGGGSSGGGGGGGGGGSF